MADVCPLCRGTGWRIVSRDGIEFAERCSCIPARKKRDIISLARIPRRYADCTLESFSLDIWPDETKKKAKQAIEYFVRAYPAVESGLLLMGNPGTGKTHLAVAAIKALMQEKGVACLFYDFRDLLKTIQSSYGKGSELSELEVLQPVLNAEVLLLDELGASKMSSWMHDTLAHILNYRYNERLITIITSNWIDKEYDSQGEETLEKRIGYRLRSRLYEMCDTIHITSTCSDYRQFLHAKHKTRLSQIF